MKCATWHLRLVSVILVTSLAWAAPLPEPYASFAQAKETRDLATLQGLAQDPGYVGVLAGFELIGEKGVSAGLRANYAVRYANYTQSQYAWLRAGKTLEEAGRLLEAAQAYGQAYPKPEAASGWPPRLRLKSARLPLKPLTKPGRAGICSACYRLKVTPSTGLRPSTGYAATGRLCPITKLGLTPTPKGQ